VNLIEDLRSRVVTHEHRKLNTDWEQRRLKLVEGFRNPLQPTQQELLAMGNRLSAAFRLSSMVQDRSQGTLSGGGNVWQALICHYLNVCLAGTDAVAVTASFVPSSIKAALKISYTGSAAVNADLDVMVVVAPDSSKQTSGRNPKRLFSEYVETRFADCSVVAIQAKTNWNDNAQIPMLWNFIYNLAWRGQIPRNGFSVGSGSWHLSALKSFSYAFVTVPTNNLESFNPQSMPVLRVATMSGGAYWGRATRNGVIQSLTEFFAKNYNVSNHHFPAPATAGAGFAAEIANPTGEIDTAAFSLVTPSIV